MAAHGRLTTWLLVAFLLVDAAAQPPQQQQQHAVALFDYHARESDELSVSAGDLLTYFGVAEGEDEWAQCESEGGRKGVIPLSYLKVVAPVPATASTPPAAASSTSPICQPEIASPVSRWRLPHPHRSNDITHSLCQRRAFSLVLWPRRLRSTSQRCYPRLHGT